VNVESTPLGKVVTSLAAGGVVDWLPQSAILAASLLLAWAFARHIRNAARVNPRWQFGKGGFERVALPLMALMLVWAGKIALVRRGYDTALLDFIHPLIVAFAFVRAASYVFGHVIPEGPFQRALIAALAWGAGIAVVLQMTGFLPEAARALESVGFSYGKDKTEITLLDIVKGVIAMFLTVTFALYVARVTEGRVMAAQSIDITTRVVISRVVRVAAMFLAIFIALPMAGVDVTTLSVFSGALGVGLGFGLQKVASNYVSGFIVLLDRSLRIGDIVTVDGRRGEVNEVGARYTVIRGGDGVESIIPNEKLITESVNHHTYSDPRVSVVVNVSVAHDSDVPKACELLLEFAHSHKRIIPDPAPTARVKQITELGVDLELTVWIKDPAVGDADVKSALYLDILKGFKAHAIEIPYPHRVVHLIATAETGNPRDVSRP
jgi:small-conductance mechanosensitive channel